MWTNTNEALVGGWWERTKELRKIKKIQSKGGQGVVGPLMVMMTFSGYYISIEIITILYGT
jgi:hypothetical protein